jgi:hypothetical protein
MVFLDISLLSKLYPMKKLIIILILTVFSYYANSQDISLNFQQHKGGVVNGEYWPNAFYGSTTELSIDFGDLDNDGDLDLMQGSRYRLEWMRNIGSPMVPEFGELNWGNLIFESNRMLSPCLVDIDNDDDLDLFCGAYGNISFYENIGNPNNPVFSAELENYSDIQISGNADLSFCDLDNDNDLDLFIGGNEGIIHYYKNTGSDIIPNFEEQSIELIDTIQNNSISVEFVDINFDGDYDLFIGTRSGRVYYYENVGTDNNPIFTLITNNYNNIYCEYSKLKIRFYDIDNDDDKDMFISDLKGYFYYYENIGDKYEPIWNLGTSCFNKTLNFGRGSAPAGGDIDNDGDNDLVFGNATILENVGTADTPSWFFNDQLTNNPDYLFDTPTLVDIDGDNDLDLFYGKDRGYIEFYKNYGNSTNPDWVLINSNYENINYGSSSHVSVTFTDIDGDEDYDMFVQHVTSSGDNMSYYNNIGNINEPIWSLQEENYLNLGHQGIGFGRCSFGDIDHDNDFDCLCGDSGGTFYLYLNTGNSNNPEWFYEGEISNGIGAENGTFYSSPILIDLNNDSYPEIISGHDGGGLNYWNNTSNVIVNFEYSINSCDQELVFNDLSYSPQGEIVSWFWEFDDPESGTNNTSNEKNPLHKFMGNTSIYNVKLTIVDNSGNEVSVTKIVDVKPKVSITGNVLTNEGNQISDGYVVAFIISTGNIPSYIDSGSIDPNGIFSLENISVCEDYIIRAFPNSETYPLVIPRYHYDAFYWANAIPITVNWSDTLLTEKDIQLFEFIPPPSGSSSISGGIYYRNSKGEPVKNIDVVLEYDDPTEKEMKVSGYQKSSDLGLWSFNDLPEGTYRILVDIPGLNMDSVYTVTLSEPNTDIGDLNYYVDLASGIYTDATGIEELNKNPFGSIRLFPNPTKGNFSIVIEKSSFIDQLNIQSVELYDLNGQLIQDFNITHQGNRFIKNIQLENIEKGIYFIKVNSNGVFAVKKLVLIK